VGKWKYSPRPLNYSKMLTIGDSTVIPIVLWMLELFYWAKPL